jgi:hypothetical protein
MREHIDVLIQRLDGPDGALAVDALVKMGALAVQPLCEALKDESTRDGSPAA